MLFFFAISLYIFAIKLLKEKLYNLVQENMEWWGIFMVKTFTKDKLVVSIYENRTLMGEAASNDIAICMEKLLAEKESINMVFAI